jgi:hypothetical protein
MSDCLCTRLASACDGMVLLLFYLRYLQVVYCLYPPEWPWSVSLYRLYRLIESRLLCIRINPVCTRIQGRTSRTDSIESRTLILSFYSATDNFVSKFKFLGRATRELPPRVGTLQNVASLWDHYQIRISCVVLMCVDVYSIL